MIVGGSTPVLSTWFGAHLRTSAIETGSRVALSFEGRSWTYAELDRAIRCAVQALTGRGVARGDRVIMQGAALPEAIVGMFAVTRMGAILVPLHPRVTPAELAVVCRETSPRAVLGDHVFRQSWDHAAVGAVALDWNDLSADTDDELSVDVPLDDDVAMIAFTSGTSGAPKGAVLTHGNLHWSAHNGLLRLPVAQDDVTLLATPLAHVAVLGGLPQYTWARRGTVVLAPRFDVDRFFDLVRDHRATVAFAVPAMLALLIRSERFHSPDLESLKWVLAGGSPAMSATTTQLLTRGIRVVNSYGLTESSAGVTYVDAHDVVSRPTSAGKPVPYVDLRIADDAGQPVPAGIAGEIWLRGPSISSSYWTSAGLMSATDERGWFHTGDRGRCDGEGRLEVIGRTKDTIITGGENVDPAEVEDALADLPGLLEVAVGGQPDPVWGEIVTAFVVAVAAAEPSVDDVRRHLDGRLAKHKWPRRVHVVSALPRGATGKLQRQELGTLLAPGPASELAAGTTGITPPAHTEE